MGSRQVCTRTVELACIVLLMMAFEDKQHDPQTTYEITVDPNTYTDLSHISTEGLQYYDSMEETIKNANTKMFEGYECAREVDTPIKILESDTEALFFYLSYETGKSGYFVITRYVKENLNVKEKYG